MQYIIIEHVRLQFTFRVVFVIFIIDRLTKLHTSQCNKCASEANVCSRRCKLEQIDARMTPHSTKKHSSPMTNLQEVQLTKKVSKVKRAVDQPSKAKNNVKTNARILTRARKAISTKSDQSSSHGTSKKKKTSKSNFAEQDISNQVEAEKHTTHSGTKVQEKKTNKNRKVIKKTNTDAKQMSLKESFLNQSRMVLRSRKKPTDTLTKEANDNKKKLPVYIQVSPEKSQIEKNSEIYEFTFDIDDSKERVRKKVKKRTIVKRRAVNRRKKNVAVKQSSGAPNAEEANVEMPATTDELETACNTEKAKPEKLTTTDETARNTEKANAEKPASNDQFERAEKTNALGLAKQENKKTDSKEDLNNTKSAPNVELNMESEKPDDAITRKIINREKPKIISIRCLSNESGMDNSDPSNPDDFKPFRPTNIFGTRLTVPQKNGLNASLFEKSLSPIKRPADSLQLNNNSPWRVSPLPTFSQVKSAYQSTPHNNNNNNNNNDIHKTLPRTLNNDPRQFGSAWKSRNNLQKSNDSVICNTPKSKNSLISRKFGTEITNIDHSLQSKSPVEINGRTSAKSSEDTENFFNPKVLKLTERRNNILSPKKRSPFKKSNVMFVKADVHVADEQKENLDPLPGPSGLQSTPARNEQHVLRQSNLNNFLNIAEAPQSSTIRTSHGIFDDPESISIAGKSLNKSDKYNVELKTAFGFDDDSSPERVTVNDKPTASNLKSLNEKPVTRLLVDEIKNVLLKKDEPKNEQKPVEVVKEKKVMKSPVEQKINAINFSDTFDILSETGDITETSVTEIPLFTDCEPIHFKEPPRYSYKRKQVSQLDFSEHESEKEEEEEEIVHRKKRKKTNKPKKQLDKRFIEWINDINKTFHGIEEHELVVE